VNKTYRKGRVAAVDRKLVHGTQDGLVSVLDASSASSKINTVKRCAPRPAAVRQNGTDRAFNA